MPKPQKKQPISPLPQGGFWTGEETPRVGLYARVSTHDQQTLPMQLSAMRSYARKRGWTVAVEVKDVGSGATARPLREKLIETARRREIDSVLVWRLDRWGRSLVDLVNTLQELTALDVGFVSLSEALDLTTPKRTSSRRHAGRVCGIRTGYFAGPCEGGDRSSAKGRKTSWAANDRR
jgi:Resolvase, N terminal domain